MGRLKTAAFLLQAIIVFCRVDLQGGGVQAQTTPDQPEGRPKYQRALTDLVPANLITVLDKYHRPITNNYVPEPTKQKLTKAEILARFTTQRKTTTTTTTTTTTSTTTRKPSTFVTSFPGVTALTSAEREAGGEAPFRILFIQTTTSTPNSGETETTTPSFFSHVVTQTAKTVTVIEDGQERTETLPPQSPTSSAGQERTETVPPQSPSTSSKAGQSRSATKIATEPAQTSPPANFSPVFIYKNHRFTSDAPKPVVSVASRVTTSDGELITPEVKSQTLSVQQLQNLKTTAAPGAVSSPRPRRKVIKVKSRKLKKDDRRPSKEVKRDQAGTTAARNGDDKASLGVTTTNKEESRIAKDQSSVSSRLSLPQKANPGERSTTFTPLRGTTPVPASDSDGILSSRLRRPSGLRRLPVGISNSNRVLTKEPEKPTTTTAPLLTNPGSTTQTTRALFRSRITTQPASARSTASTGGPTAVLGPTERPTAARLPQTLATRTLSTGRVTTPPTTTGAVTSPPPETPTVQPPTSTGSGVTTRGTSARSPPRRVVTRLGTARPTTTIAATTPLPETPTAATAAVANGGTSPTSAVEFTPTSAKPPRKVVKRKRKPTSAPSTLPRTTVTPVSIVYFQTTSATTPGPEVSYDVSRRTLKRRRKRPSSPAGVVSTQTLPASFSPTEPSTFSAPAAVTGFRPLSTSTNFFGSPTPDHHHHHHPHHHHQNNHNDHGHNLHHAHLDTLPKTDEISQVINLPGGRLSSYQTRYTPQTHQHTLIDSQPLISDREFVPLSSASPLNRPFAREAPHQRAIRPGPSFTPEGVNFYGNAASVGDPTTFQDLQRLFAADNSRFHNQPRNSARFAGFRPPLHF